MTPHSRSGLRPYSEIRVPVEIAASSASGRIDREAELLKALSGQNRRDFTLPVPRFYQRGQHQGRSLLCMELLGPNLEQVLGAEGALDEALTYDAPTSPAKVTAAASRFLLRALGASPARIDALVPLSAE